MSQTERVHRTELGTDRIELLVPQLVRHTEQRTLQSSVLEGLQSIVSNVNRFRSPEQRLGVFERLGPQSRHRKPGNDVTTEEAAVN